MGLQQVIKHSFGIGKLKVGKKPVMVVWLPGSLKQGEWRLGVKPAERRWWEKAGQSWAHHLKVALPGWR